MGKGPIEQDLNLTRRPEDGDRQLDLPHMPEPDPRSDDIDYKALASQISAIDIATISLPYNKPVPSSVEWLLRTIYKGKPPAVRNLRLKTVFKKVLLAWIKEDKNPDHVNNTDQIAQAYLYAIELISLIKIQEEQSATRDRENRIFTEGNLSIWNDEMRSSLEWGVLSPALLYLIPSKWRKVCEGREYKAYLETALKILGKNIPEIINIVAPACVKHFNCRELGLGTGEKTELITREMLKGKRRVKLEAVDASYKLLLLTLYEILKSMIENSANIGLLDSDQENLPCTEIPGITRFCRNHTTELPYNRPSTVKPSDGTAFIEEVERIFLKFLTREPDWTKRNKLLNHWAAAMLGLHTLDTKLLDELNESINKDPQSLEVVPLRKIFDELGPPPPATLTERTLITALGNTPLGNNEIEYTMDLINKWLDEPQIINGEVVANHMLLGVHLRTGDLTPEDPEALKKQEEEMEAMLVKYSSRDFIYFVTYPFLTEDLKMSIYDSAGDPGHTKRLETLEQFGAVNVVYNDCTDPAGAGEQKATYHRIEHWLEFTQNVDLVGQGDNPWTMQRKKGDRMLLHYSYKFTMEELTELFESRGFKIVKVFTDTDDLKDGDPNKKKPTVGKFLIRKMTEEEKTEYKESHPASESFIRVPGKRRKSGTYRKPLLAPKKIS